MENNQNIPPVSASTFWQKYKKIVFIFVLLIVIAVSGWFLFRAVKENKATPTSESNNTQEIVSNSEPSKPVDNIKAVPNDQYDLFRYVDDGSQYVVVPTVKYKEDGIVESGKYSGYNRVVASADYGELGSRNVIFFFATKDYKHFVLDRSLMEYYQDQTLDKNKIMELGDIEPEFPNAIQLNNFTLTKTDFDLNAVYSKTSKLPSTLAEFSFYTDQSEYFNNSANLSKVFIEGKSKVYVVDKYGLAASYNLETVEWGVRAKNHENYYEYDFYDKSDLSSSESLYKKYGQLMPGGCGQIGVSFVLKNINSDDLVSIGKTNRGVEVFTLKDKNHPINKDQYESKVNEWKSIFSTLNDIEPPTYEAYVSKNPVIILKDDLGRWLALGEWEYQTGGGCGKPVIYLYPKEPTEVTLQFVNPMKFNIDIPRYDGGWKMLANPNGDLKDLHPDKTPCDLFNTTSHGSEYAKEACVKNNYPYIYWAGYTTNTYPHTEKGWVVKSDELESFLISKLSEMGLNAKEKSDFVEYWVPKLQTEKTPYFKISFFQNKEMDRFIPMNINPKPDSTIRIFMDWEPLSQKPTLLPVPQVLEGVEREGFTLVEWGGINK